MTVPPTTAGGGSANLRGLVWTLVRTDFKVRYHGTAGASRELQWCDERGIGTDEDPVAHVRGMLADAVIVAGNGAGTNIAFGADLGIANIAQVIDLAALTHHGLLDWRDAHRRVALCRHCSEQP